MYKGKDRQELEKGMKMEGRMSEVLAKLSSVLVNNLIMRCEIQNGVKNDFEILFWVAERLEMHLL